MEYLIEGSAYVLVDFGEGDFLIDGAAFLLGEPVTSTASINHIGLGFELSVVAITSPDTESFLIDGVAYVLVQDGIGEFLIEGGGYFLSEATEAPSDSIVIAHVGLGFEQSITATFDPEAGAGAEESYLIPGVAYVIHTSEVCEFLIEGGAYLNQISLAAAAPGTVITHVGLGFEQAIVGTTIKDVITHVGLGFELSISATSGSPGNRIAHVFGFEVASFQFDAAQFDGVNDFVHGFGGLPTTVDASKVVFSAEFLRTSAPLISEFLYAEPDDAIWIQLNTFGQIEVLLASETALFAFRTVSSYCDGTYKQIVVSANTNAQAGSKTGQILVNGVLASIVVLSDSSGAFDVAFSEVAEWTVAAGTGGINKYAGSLGEVFLHVGSAPDLSDGGNVARFWQNGHPKSFGFDGSDPLGSVPLVYLHLDHGETANNLAVNRGNRGAMVLEGVLTTAPVQPDPGAQLQLPNFEQSITAVQSAYNVVIAHTLPLMEMAALSGGVAPSTTIAVIAHEFDAFRQLILVSSITNVDTVIDHVWSPFVQRIVVRPADAVLIGTIFLPMHPINDSWTPQAGL